MDTPEEQLLLRELKRLMALSGINRRHFLLSSGSILSSLGIISLISGCSNSVGNTESPAPPTPELKPDQSYHLCDAVYFYDFGSWKLDTQFFERLGSASLLAADSEGGGAPARARITIEKSGNYQIFVHNKNWDPLWSPGQFRVSINGEMLDKTLGMVPDAGWLWEKAGQVSLSPGPVEVALHDLTGAYGRCDSVLLTTSAEFVPPNGSAGMALLREKNPSAGDGATIKDLGSYDFVVAGGGLAGSIAALTAARNGLKVALLQNRPVLGGNASNEVGVYVETAAVTNPHARESGLVEELAREASRLGINASTLGWQEALAAACAVEPNLSLFLNTELTGVLMKTPSQVEAVFVTQVTTGEKYVVRGTVFADCTGDADLGAAAGAEFRIGREPSEMYGEQYAPLEADRVTLGTSLLYWVQYMPDSQPFAAPSWAHYFDQEKLSLVDNLGPFWWVEWGGRKDTINDEEEIRDELLRIVYGIWDYIKNRSPLAEKARNYKLMVRPVAGKRESRRLIGDHVLTEGDLKNVTNFDDAAGYGGWPIDLHKPDGFYDPAPDTTWYRVNLYTIPLRSLYSRNIDNLLMAGRNISASHVALGSTRIMGTCGVLGQAVGTAAVMCNKYGVFPRAVRSNHVHELQQILLRDDAYIPGAKNEDPADFARFATVTASSTLATAGYEPGNVVNGVSRTVGTASNLWASDPAKPMPQWLQLSLGQPTPVNYIQITFDTDLNTPTYRRTSVPETVRNYEIQVLNDNVWLTVATVKGNYQRLRRHSFEMLPAGAVRIVVNATNGSLSARIYEVRIYLH